MKKTCNICAGIATSLLLASCSVGTDGTPITINLSEKGADVAPSMYGVFFEEINHAGDGGLYAELVQNRSFEEKEMPEGYTVKNGRLIPEQVKHHLSGQTNSGAAFIWNNEPVRGWSLLPDDEKLISMELTKNRPKFSTAPNNLKVTIADAKQPTSLVNSGYWGMGIQEGETYLLRAIVRKAPDYAGTVTAKIVSEEGTTIATAPLTINNANQWNDLNVELTASATDDKARLVLDFDAKGTLWFDYVSLFPKNTFNNRPNGLRKDVAQFLADLKPAFFRWPGGCVVEGITLSNRFDWKKTLGDPAARPGEYSTWGYRCSYGMGYHEILQYCEDIGAQAMYVCNVGIACELRMGDACPESDVQFYLDDCFDAIEYAIGDVSTEWGARRAQAGHPEPFPLKYVEIGNENWGPVYDRRFDLFYKAIKEKYPQLILIYDDMSGLREEERGIAKTDMIDPHWYVAPDFFYRNSELFDTKQRGKWEVYVGEYACNQGVGGGNMNAALSEAAFISGMERNGDLVTMTSYAPLFENVNNREWSTNLIWIDTDQVMGRTSYYVQKMYSENRPTYNIACSTTTISPDSVYYAGGAVGLGTWDTQAEYKDIKVTENGNTVHLEPHTANAVLSKLFDGQYSNTATLECKARKISGSEGFLIFFGMTPDGKLGYRYNIGGWGNTGTALQRLYAQGDQVVSRTARQRIETDRWYDIRVELTPKKSSLYMDGKLIVEHQLEPVPSQFLATGYDEATGEMVIKFVNAASDAHVVDFTLEGTTQVASAGKVITLQAEELSDENSMEHPEKIVPVESRFNGFGKTFTYEFPKYSFTILRVKAQK